MIGSKNGNSGVAAAFTLAEGMLEELTEQTERLGRVIGAVEASRKRRATRRINSESVVADALGDALFVYNVTPGQGWTLVSHAGVASAATTGYGAIYLGERAAGNIIRAFPTGTVFSDDFSTNEYVPTQSRIVVVLGGQTPGTICHHNLRVEIEDD